MFQRERPSSGAFTSTETRCRYRSLEKLEAVSDCSPLAPRCVSLGTYSQLASAHSLLAVVRALPVSYELHAAIDSYHSEEHHHQSSPMDLDFAGAAAANRSRGFDCFP